MTARIAILSLVFSGLSLTAGPARARKAGWVRQLIAPTSVSRRGADVRVVRRDTSGSVSSVIRYRPNGSYTRLERQLVRGADGRTHQRTVSQSGTVGVRGRARVWLERLKAVGDSYFVRGVGFNLATMGAYQAAGLSLPVAVALSAGNGYSLREFGGEIGRKIFAPTDRRTIDVSSAELVQRLNRKAPPGALVLPGK